MDRDSSTADTVREPYERVTVENLRKEVARRKLKLIKRGPDSNNTKDCLVQLLRDNDRGIEQQVVAYRPRPSDDAGRNPVPRIAAAVSVQSDQFRPVPPAPILLPIPVFSNAPSPMIRPRAQAPPLAPCNQPSNAPLPSAVAAPAPRPTTTTPAPRPASTSRAPHSSVDYSMAEVMTSLLKRRRSDETDEEQLDHAIKSLDMISRALMSVNAVIANLRDELVHTTEPSDEHECMAATLGHFKRVRMEFLKETQHFTWVSTHAMTNPQPPNRPLANNAQPPASAPRTSPS
ncbi:hypothetical protein SDRG_14107 [Saprolegnia diclina VS20]|uniref:Uncharacterized protein n=1 Tax=Saprolegnia diclina (strain VS20) TaxID=1156394 RepID=T0Q3Z7_SAPDV|nr:hypothetical protein SDRG_14107 [Saprolegnia diclina VS20]EQC28150.1 hypothetical protein SDRG_14107 [Saprolegnia diclina VS20]|eukprot:XP_008618436.1 hypothetical protein SDRG_14107 [Saprolegnia diclina VS20]